MSIEDPKDLPGLPAGGLETMEQAAATYGRELSAEDYWWLGVGLAACTIAELGEKPYAVGRLQQHIDRAGHKGVRGDWVPMMIDELAQLDSEGLLWPVYYRNPDGIMERTDTQVHAGFDGRSGYFLALAHLAVAVAVNREQQDKVQQLAGAITAMIESGLTEAHEQLVLGTFTPEE